MYVYLAKLSRRVKIKPMKITTWNVNGLRAALGKGFHESLQALGSDVLCLQEVRAAPGQIDAGELQRLGGPFPHMTWNPAERPGYSGVATFARQQPEQVSLGMNAPAFDTEGRVIRSRHPGFLLFNIYFPNGGRSLERVPYKLEFYAHLLDHCDALHAAGEQIILCGDFNTSHRPIDLRNPKQNEKNSGFLPEERALDRSLPGARLRRYLSPALSRTRPVHLVDLHFKCSPAECGLAAGLFPGLPIPGRPDTG